MRSSKATISALVNTMIGGTMLTIPILFRESGVVTGLLILLVSGVISYLTCELYILHMGEKDASIEDTIRRLLGAKWEGFFKALTGIYLVCLNAIYIDIIIDQCYSILFFILNKAHHGNWIAEKDTVTFDKFSIQYLSILMFLPLLRITFVRDFTLILKLTSLGVLAVVLYMFFIFYEFATSVLHVDWKNVPLFKRDVGNLAGTCAVAFTIHTMVNPIMKANRNQANNARDLRISYFLGFLIYATIGVLGCISIVGKDCKTMIVNCYKTEWLAVGVEATYFFMLLTVYPCFIEVGRNRLLEHYFGEITDRMFRIFNVIFVSLSCLLAFLSPYLPLDLVMNLVGSFLCFFFVYMIPIKFHWSCVYKEAREDKVSLITQDESEPKATCPHGDLAPAHSKLSRGLFYGVILGVGVAVALYGVYQFFQQVFGE